MFHCQSPAFLSLAVAASSLFVAINAAAADSINVLIVDGRNNHDWVITTDALQATLESTGRFAVAVTSAPGEKVPRPPYRPRNTDDAAVLADYDEAKLTYDEKTKPIRDTFKEEWQKWRPDFSAHDVVVLNYNGPDWPKGMQEDFVEFVRTGGGLVLVHAANNGFRNWPEFNEMIGLGWRPAPFGHALKIDPDTGKTFADEKAGNSGHGSKHPFQITVRAAEHPIMRGVPEKWMHAQDELYHHMRGPAKNLTVLSSAFSEPEQRGTGLHEPITWEVGFGKGRVIVTSMGHHWPRQETWDSLYCVGFQTIFARSCEYAATGAVTLPIPEKFPDAIGYRILPPSKVEWEEPLSGDLTKIKDSALARKKADPYCQLTPEEESTTFDLAPGFVADLAAAEPDVQEPVLTVWDGNGAMYVAEMRSYMQDADGTGTKTLKNGRIKRLEDTTGDGILDKVTIFVDGLNLPRMILPLDDRIAVRESDTMDVVAYRDTDGDGVADEKTMLYERGPDGRGNVGTSVEHQDSGLIWNLDNHIYISYNAERYRFTDGEWKAEKQNSHWTQWGLDHDDEGRLFWSQNSGPLVGVQLHPKYWSNARRRMTKSFAGDPVDLGTPYDPDFMNVKSLCMLNDRGGEAPEVRAFTSACGQSVFRGHKFPIDARGDYFVCDPTIHVVRQANIIDRDGLTFLEKANPDSDREFLLSSDINCRFVNTATGPDGCLYVTDMYRGIIQDAPWMSPGPRQFTRESGLAGNNQHGRIWRIRHRDHQPGRRPQMLEESTGELLRHLQHPNGWWRDTAQKLIILRDDRDTVVPLLAGMARFDENPLARLHALWTLEGIGAVTRDNLSHSLADRDPRLRRAAVQISEAFLIEEGMIDDLTLLSQDPDGEVAEQLIFSLGQLESLDENKNALALVQDAARNHLTQRGVMLATAVSLWGMKDQPLIAAIADSSAFSSLTDSELATALPTWTAILSNWDRGLTFPEDMPKEEQRAIQGGEVTYYRVCVACHGSDGKGFQIAGTDQYLAPSLADSPRAQGPPEQLIPILLHGLIGPLDGKTYQAGFMAPAHALGVTRDDRLAELLNYIRFAWNQERKPAITKEQIGVLRNIHQDRTAPWTQGDLETSKEQLKK